MIRFLPLCALMWTLLASLNAQTRLLPAPVELWLGSKGLEHATVALQVAQLPDSGHTPPKVTYQLDAQRMVIPASVMKLVTTATALELLGGDYVMPGVVPILGDTTVILPPGLEAYNPAWMLEDVNDDYMPPLSDTLADCGRLLRDVVRDVNHKSLNLQAETLLHLLTPSCKLDSGLLCIQDYWGKAKGFDLSGLRMLDGCGLSPNDRLTPHFIIQLLAAMGQNDDFVSSLPEAGRAGTVRSFLRKTRLEGRARLKTGTLSSTIAYAGYITGSDAKRYAVAIFVNNYTCHSSIIRRGIADALLSLIP